MQWKNAQGDSVSDSPTEGNIPLQKDFEVTPSITTNMEAPLEVTAQNSVIVQLKVTSLAKRSRGNPINNNKRGGPIGGNSPGGTKTKNI